MSGLFAALAALPPPPAQRLPVTVLTGFLGSGKTTLLNALLRAPALHDTAVLINEFGSVGLDHDLVQHTEEDMVLLASGCVCCTVRGDLVQALVTLAAHPRVAAGAIRRVVLETTGLADPAPILHTLMMDPRVREHYVLNGLVGVVDACHAAATLARESVARKQVALADLLLVSKLDLLGGEEARAGAGWRERAEAEPEPSAETEAPDAADTAASPAGAPAAGLPLSLLTLLRQLNADAPLVSGPATQARLCELVRAPAPAPDVLPASHQVLLQPWRVPGDTTNHTADIHSFALVHDTPVAEEGLYAWLDMVAAMRGDDLLRVKGIVNVAGRPQQPLVIHGVQHLFHPPQWLPAWPSEDRRTRLVFIARHLDQATLEGTFAIFANRRRRVSEHNGDNP